MIRNSLKNKKRLAFILMAAVFVLILILSVVAALLIPKAKVFSPPQGGTAKSIARSYTDNGWYLGDSEGNITHFDENGEEIFSFRVPSDAGITQIFTDSDLDYVVAVDERLNLYAVSFEDEPTIVTQGTLSGGCYDLTADRDNVYAITSRSRYSVIRKFPKNDFSKATGQGLMYTSAYLPTAKAWSLTPIFNMTAVLFEAIDDTLYLFTEGGVGYRIANDFSMNAFDWMSSAELDEYGATMSKDGTVTIPEENFREECYNGTSFSYAIYSAAYDEEAHRFYAGYANKRLYTLDLELRETSYVSLSDTPGQTMFLHDESGLLYFNYKVLSEVGVCDVRQEGMPLTARPGNFDISELILDGAAKNAYYLYLDNIADKTDTSAKILKAWNLSKWSKRILMIGLTVAGFITSTLLGAATAVTGVFAFRKEAARNLKEATGTADGTAAGSAGSTKETTDSAKEAAGSAKTLCKRVKKNWGVYLVIFISLGLLVLFTYYPGFSSLFLSFFEYTKQRPTMQWNNFANYKAVFTNPYVGVYFRNLLLFLFFDILLALLPPVIFAVCLVFIRSKKYSTVCRVLLYIPGIIPGIASTLIWTSGIYGLDGLVNSIITACGGEPVVFLQQQDMSIFWLLMMGFPFVGSYLIFYGGLMNVPASYYEAAELDGCPIIKRIFLIDVPLITPQLKYVFVMTFISSVQNFTRVRFTTDGLYGSQVIMNVLYNYLSEGEYGISAAYGAIMFVILMLATLANLRMKTVDAEG